jgi:hypothetical protein
MKLIDKGPARAALAIFVIFAIASAIITAVGAYDIPKPAPGLEAWFKLFQGAVAIVVALKIAWNIEPVMNALAHYLQQPRTKHKG